MVPLLLLLGLCTAQLYEYRTSNVVPLKSDNFQKQIQKSKESGVAIVHFYYDDHDNKAIKEVIEELAQDYQGVFMIAGLDCGMSYATCDKEGFQAGSVVIYPPMPIPHFVHEGAVDKPSLVKSAAKWVPVKNVLSITSNNFDTFVKEKPAVPKVLLFSDKKSAPLMYNSLANQFQNKMMFGFVNQESPDLIKKYKVVKFPKIIVIKSTEKKPSEYTGAVKYKDIFDFLNVFSETFVYGGGTAEDSAAGKPWLNEAVPELYRDSGDDICFKSDSLCVIFCSAGQISDEDYEKAKKVSKQFPSDNVPRFTFMWLDTEKENLCKLFQGDEENVNGKFAVLNPGKRKRYLVHQGEAETLPSTLTKITNGDARFKIVKGNQLPALSHRKQ